MLSETLSALQNRSPDLVSVHTALRYMSEMAEVTSRIPPGRWLSECEVMQIFLLVCHEVLSLPRYYTREQFCDPASNSLVMREVIRLASLLFITGPVRVAIGDHEFTLKHLGQLPRLMRMVEMDWTGLEDLELWVLVVGALVERGDDREWMVSRIFHRMESRDLNWDRVAQNLREIAWIDDVFSESLGILRNDWVRHMGLLSS